MRAREKMGFRWMKTNGLHNTFTLIKRSCRITPIQTMNHNLTRSLNIMSQSCKIVTLRVPNHFANYMFEINFNHFI